ncbi:aldo/keto reductase [Kribbia dieselivorans]|uniref:aldo/keto reductase n=1 Tax=Kribbia dieselivorans TaxID=331526 RepID=UPI000A85CC77|nr:aldo/keto reductase [Kribbia dieselivorans]
MSAAERRLGLGTYGLTGEAGIAAIESGLRAGYRLLDTAVSYGNEPEVGQALRRSEVPRAEVFVQTKLPGRRHAHVRDSVLGSLDALGLERLDGVLIHWPNPERDLYVRAWEGLISVQAEGLVGTIGVSNFTPAHLQRIIEATGVVPAINQVEVHPYFAQTELRREHRRWGIVTQAWSPLGKGTRLLSEPAVLAVAERRGVTPAQAVLGWHLAAGVVPLPKSVSAARQVENLAALDVALTAEDLTELAGLDRPNGRRRADLNPDTHEEW